MSWSSPKFDLVTNFLNLESRKFSERQFLSIVTFKNLFLYRIKNIPLFSKLFIPFHDLFISLIEVKNFH